MEKYFITGAGGFVGKYFIDYLESKKENVIVIGLDTVGPIYKFDYKFVNWRFYQLDLINQIALENIIRQEKPDYILHLAAYSSVAFSWENPILSYQNNLNIFLNILESVRKTDIQCRILSVGSSEVYGNINSGKEYLSEDSILDPVSPYAVARVSQEFLSKVYVKGYGLDIALTRSFNHTGPGQKDVFFIPSIAKQIYEIKKGKKSDLIIKTGNLDIIRDFTDVRDVVEAYYLLLTRGCKGEIYNVCSGNSYSLRDICNELAIIADVEVEFILDHSRVRPDDNLRIVGSNDKIYNHILWKPKISISQSLNDIYTELENKSII